MQRKKQLNELVRYKWQKLIYLISALINYAIIYCCVYANKIISPKKQTIGLLLTEHLGDLVAAEPILKKLKEKFPSSSIYWIVKPHFEDLVKYNPLVDYSITQFNTLTLILLNRKSPFDVFYNLHLNDLIDDPYFKTPLINQRAKDLCIDLSNYLSRFNLLEVSSQLADLGPIKGFSKIYFPKDFQYIVPRDPYLIIHRKSNASQRDWNDTLWNKMVLDIIHHFQIAVIEIGVKDGLNLKHPQFSSYVGKTSLLETMKLVESADFFIGVESGPAHLANAFKIKSLILCGHFHQFKKYNVYNGEFQSGEIANVYFNPKGPTSTLEYDQVWEQLIHTYSPIQTFDLAN